MCLILLAYHVEPNFPVIVAANRDEYFVRPTRKAHFWTDHPEIFAGRDLQEKGTWMGVTRTGRMAAVTNWSLTCEPSSRYRSRGDLVRKFLIADSTSLDFVQAIDPSDYRGCNLVVYDGIDLVYWNNHDILVEVLDPGLHGITNAGLKSYAPRANNGIKELKRLTDKHDARALLAMLGPRQSKHPDDCFIVGRDYGTRASTTLVIGTDSMSVCEQQYEPNAVVGSLTTQTIDFVRQ